mmetsp:Transcript_31447/g.70029  ORF Transcript_31447/g.70029 Transcript_31447/m.70029 type:complete len:173 (-) Transcript_31447:735-1253(-)|eukprot:CAMPEP_0202890802 /NCGR_PEP_ID=MMETSP1392-20130828/1093_1 /ASSEMBLY_ACC=CAM_ASM_000868 /TAXON_ID=225041 /ORGANISM="Chlamydomonas chlamydogama, Strain SAG 11-48b" /LENGTH=172 /DNA_ID=CAMNT_0049574441 /DNA_START=585 /DNA_END=1103 /DNA_ORIENTATION=+
MGTAASASGQHVIPSGNSQVQTCTDHQDEHRPVHDTARLQNKCPKMRDAAPAAKHGIPGVPDGCLPAGGTERMVPAQHVCTSGSAGGSSEQAPLAPDQDRSKARQDQGSGGLGSRAGGQQQGKRYVWFQGRLDDLHAPSCKPTSQQRHMWRDQGKQGKPRAHDAARSSRPLG